MRMADVNGAGSRGLVSARRDQILEKMNSLQQKGDMNLGTENVVPAFTAFMRAIPPPVPAHRPKSTTYLTKPPVAPKPPHISHRVRPKFHCLLLTYSNRTI
ncbi:unnamed protein product [Strongylus vulgaris]|uniref:Uncharacterized protein n=1 Tax=Strongylus vulgaris TaxID=40348 RepID=A0A3P7I5E4_STRVU|nr:unnamed protein product [Strongylus vulgaris]